MIYCEFLQCPYREKGGFCTRTIVDIDSAGRCGYLYLNGVPRKHFTEIPPDYKMDISVFEIENENNKNEEEKNDEQDRTTATEKEKC